MRSTTIKAGPQWFSRPWARALWVNVAAVVLTLTAAEQYRRRGTGSALQ